MIRHAKQRYFVQNKKYIEHGTTLYKNESKTASDHNNNCYYQAYCMCLYHTYYQAKYVSISHIVLISSYSIRFTTNYFGIGWNHTPHQQWQLVRIILIPQLVEKVGREVWDGGTIIKPLSFIAAEFDKEHKKTQQQE